MLFFCAGLAFPASAGNAEAVREAEARAALDDSVWAFVHWSAETKRAAEAFGVTPPEVSTRYVYAGDDGLLNLSATAEADAVSLRLEGSGWRERDPKAERILTRNAAHEVAHVFQYAVGNAMEARWLHEGFADALAHEALSATNEATGWGGGLRCAAVLEAGPIDTAQASGNQNALYDCSSLTIRAVADARGQSVRDLYVDFTDEGGTDAAFLRLAREAGDAEARSVTAFLTRDWRHANPGWVIAGLRAGRL